MKKIIFIAFSLIGHVSQAQKIEFGVSYSGGVNFSGKKPTIEMINEGKTYPYQFHFSRPHSIWNTHQLQLDVYPVRIKGFLASIGLRMFTFGGEIDTVSAGYVTWPPGGGMTYYGRRESKFGFILPTIGVAYQHSISHNFKLRHSASLGVFSFFEREKQHSFPFDENGKDIFLDRDEESSHNSFNVETDVQDFQLSSELIFSFNGFSVSIGPAFYYMIHGTSHSVNHFSSQVKGGISYRFSRKEK